MLKIDWNFIHFKLKIVACISWLNKYYMSEYIVHSLYNLLGPQNT